MVRTRDISLAAYIRFRKHDLVEYTINMNGRDGEWAFDISEDDLRQLKIDYVNSDISAFEGIRRGMSKQKYS